MPSDPEQRPDESELDDSTGPAREDGPDSDGLPDEEPDGEPDPGLAEQ